MYKESIGEGGNRANMERRWEIVINRGGEGGENERTRGHNT